MSFYFKILIAYIFHQKGAFQIEVNKCKEYLINETEKIVGNKFSFYFFHLVRKSNGESFI